MTWREMTRKYDMGNNLNDGIVLEMGNDEEQINSNFVRLWFYFFWFFFCLVFFFLSLTSFGQPLDFKVKFCIWITKGIWYEVAKRLRSGRDFEKSRSLLTQSLNFVYQISTGIGTEKNNRASHEIKFRYREQNIICTRSHTIFPFFFFWFGKSS